MKQYTADKIRNVALAGHSSAGKTSLAEMLLFKSGATDRLGKIADGNTVCDFDPEEIKRQVSVSSAIAPFDWNGVKINLLDTPGMFDFAAAFRRASVPPRPCCWSFPPRTAWASAPRRLTAWLPA